MEWVKSGRYPLTMLVANLDSGSKKDPNVWKMVREQIVNSTNYTCRYCGGRYIKYLHCIHIDDNKGNIDIDNLDTCCRLCYIVTHINYNFNNVDNSVILCKSRKKQVNIVRETVDYIMKNNAVPPVNIIDPEAKQLKLTTTELSNIISFHNSNNESLPNELHDYRIFFTDMIDTSFIDANYTCKGVNLTSSEGSYMFVDTDEDMNKDVNDEEVITSILNDDLEFYEFTEAEVKFLNKYFSDSSTKLIDTEMDDAINKNLNRMYEDAYRFAEIDVQYQQVIL